MAPSSSSATLVRVSGSVYVERNGTRYSLAEGDELFSTDTIITDPSATAELLFADGTQATLSPGTTLAIQEFVFETGTNPSFILNLTEGAIRSVSGEIVRQNPEAFSIRTPQSTIGIRGTELFNSVLDGKETHIVLHIAKGHIVLVSTADGREIVMDAPMHGVELVSGDQAPLLIQTYTFAQMEELIRTIAPELSGNLPSADNPLLPEENTGAENTGTSSTSLTITIIAEETALADPESVTTLQNLLAALQELGVTLNILTEDGETLFSQDSQPDSGLFSPLFPQDNTPPSFTDTPPNTSADTSTPPETGPYILRTYTDITGTIGTDHLPDLSANATQKFVVTGSVQSSLIGNTAAADSQTSTAGDIFELDTVDIPLEQSLQQGVFADARSISTAQGLNLVLGADSIQIRNLKHGVISGDVYTLTGEGEALDAPTTAVFGNDTISVGTMAGGVIAGDVFEATQLKNGSITFGDDTVVAASVSQGVLVGDAYTVNNMQGGTITCGDDTLDITGTFQGELLAGDAHTIHTLGTGGKLVLGNDTITVNTQQSGIIAGDASILDSAAQGTVQFGNDTLSVQTMAGGMLVGDIHTITNMDKAAYRMGDDTLHVTTMGESATIVGDIANISATSGSIFFGNDTITVGTMQGGTIYGDFQSANGQLGSMQLGDDTIYVKDFYGGNIYGDFAGSSLETPLYGGNDSITINTLHAGGMVDGGSGNDTITVHSIVKGATAVISGGKEMDTQDTFCFASKDDQQMILDAEGNISINGYENLTISGFEHLAGGDGNDTLQAVANTFFTPWLTGGNGSDTFILNYLSAETGNEIITIKDFDVTDSNEKIWINSTITNGTFQRDSMSNENELIIAYTGDGKTHLILLAGLDGSTDTIFNQIISQGQIGALTAS